MRTHTIQSLEELRALIEQHDAWGLSLQAFEQRAGYRKEGNTEYITSFCWGYRTTSLQEMWELVQYIHKYSGTAQ